MNSATKSGRNQKSAILSMRASNCPPRALKAAGFEVEVGVFRCSPLLSVLPFGSGHPVIGLLGEYDALPGMSQKVKSEKDPVEAGAPLARSVATTCWALPTSALPSA